MNLLNRSHIASTFTITCCIVVSFMAGYWVYKYQIEDRDIGVVDYLTLSTAKNINMPAASLCLKDPFVDGSFETFYENNGSKAINKDAYLHYLIGENFDDLLEVVDYKKTLQLT